jgi:hypothetical protein
LRGAQLLPKYIRAPTEKSPEVESGPERGLAPVAL